MVKKHKHGGRRDGAGRKAVNPEGKTIIVGASVPRELVEQLNQLAAKRGWSRSQAITEAVRRLVGKR